jgi:hypothetical protein
MRQHARVMVCHQHSLMPLCSACAGVVSGNCRHFATATTYVWHAPVDIKRSLTCLHSALPVIQRQHAIRVMQYVTSITSATCPLSHKAVLQTKPYCSQSAGASHLQHACGARQSTKLKEAMCGSCYLIMPVHDSAHIQKAVAHPKKLITTAQSAAQSLQSKAAREAAPRQYANAAEKAAKLD